MPRSHPQSDGEGPEKDGNVIRVAVTLEDFPHYRKAVFHCLDSFPDIVDVTFVSGSSKRDDTIPLLTDSDLRRVHIVGNHHFAGLLWQQGLISFAHKSDLDCYVFEGNARYVTTWIAAALLRARRKSVLFWTIGWHRPEKGIKRMLRLAFYQLANGLLLYGETAMQIGQSLGYPTEKMRVIGNSVAGLARTRETLVNGVLRRPRESRAFYVGAVIRINQGKRLDLLLQAVALCREKGVDVRVILVGEGPEEKSLESLAEKLDVPLIMTGAIYDPSALAELYDKLALTVVPSAVGLTAIASIQEGVPVITGDNMYEQMPEAEAIVAGVSGDFFRHGDARHLAAVMLSWLSRKDVPDRRMVREALPELWTAEGQTQRIIEEVTRVTSGFAKPTTV